MDGNSKDCKIETLRRVGYCHPTDSERFAKLLKSTLVQTIDEKDLLKEVEDKTGSGRKLLSQPAYASIISKGR